MRALLIFTAILGLAAAGCAGSDGKAAAGGAPLTAEQYREIERLYRAQVRSEDLEKKGRDRKAAKTVMRACSAVEGDDRLLTALVEVCDETVDVLTLLLDPAIEGCYADKCAEVIGKVLDAVDGFVAASRRGDDAVAESVTDEDCRRALATPPEIYEAFALLREAFEHLADALPSGKQAPLREAGSKFAEADALMAEMPAAREFLARFRNACAA